MTSFFKTNDIYIKIITCLQNIRIGHAMTNNIVDRQTNRLRKVHELQLGRIRLSFLENILVNQLVQIVQTHAYSDLVAGVLESLSSKLRCCSKCLLLCVRKDMYFVIAMMFVMQAMVYELVRKRYIPRPIDVMGHRVKRRYAVAVT